MVEPNPQQSAENIIPRVVEEEMKQAYLTYAMSVIVGRALPDVRDGLKPVQRRILYTMSEMGLLHARPFKKSARIVGECFVPGTLILTERGLVPIELVQKGDIVYTQKGKQPVEDLYEMPSKPLLKITLDNGISTTVTSGQQFKVVTKKLEFVWKEASKLTAEDYLVLRAEYPESLAEIFLGDWNNKKMYLNENIAYLLGQLLSDGWIEKGNRRGNSFRCGWGCTSLSVISHISSILNTEFGYSPTIEERNKEIESENGLVQLKRLYTIRINDSSINQFLVSTFSLHAAVASTKEVPASIYASPKKVIFSFLSGLVDGDGSIHVSRNVINYTSVSLKLIDGLQILLQQLGFMSQRYMGTSEKTHVILGREVHSRYPCYYLEICSRFAVALANELSLLEEQKRDRATSLARNDTFKLSTFDEIPYAGKILFDELHTKHRGGGWFEDSLGKKFRAGIKYKTGTKIRYCSDLSLKGLGRTQLQEWGIAAKLKKIDSAYSKVINEIIERNLYFQKVKELEILPAKKTYDLGIKEEHEFVAQGIVSHNCMGKYHPHGNTAIYDALVRMAQDFSLRYPLIKGQGNFGSIDNDPPAAERYTEAKLQKLAEELLKDIDKETVEFIDNFDGSLQEPKVLPSKIPNLLVNGSTGIAVGMATSIPPHNLTEVANAIIATIDNPQISAAELIKHVPGPDFPTGGEVICGPLLHHAYAKGKGKVTIKAICEFEGSKIIVKEIPYMVNKEEMITHIAELVNDKRIPGIRNINDESDKEGIRIVIECKKDVDPNVVLNQLYEYSRMKVSFGITLLALDKEEPKLMGMRDIIGHHIAHRKEIIIKRTEYDLREAQKKVHLLEGVLIALANIDAVVAGIKASNTVEEAERFLISAFNLSELQAKAILDMRLHKLASLEQEKIRSEHQELNLKIQEYMRILSSEQLVLNLIKQELEDIKQNYGDVRRSRISIGGDDDDDFNMEELIEEQEVVVSMTNSGYIKRLPISEYKTQRRGGKGVRSTGVKDHDFVERIYVASTHSYLLFFTDNGQVYWLKVYHTPEGSKQAQGKHISNLLELQEGEKITAIVPVRDFKEGYLFMATRLGTVKKTELQEFSNPRKGGIRAINLDEEDTLVGVKYTTGNQEIILATQQGIANRFNEEDVRSMGRAAAGVRGIRLEENDLVIGMLAAEEGKQILTLTQKGYGKRTPVSEYRLCNRGGKGVTNIKITDKNGLVKVVMLVDGSEHIMAMSKNGIAIRMKCEDISDIGRATQGVRVMRLDDDDQLAAAAKIVAEDENESNGVAAPA